jgi:hypothetical protein
VRSGILGGRSACDTPYSRTPPLLHIFGLDSAALPVPRNCLLDGTSNCVHPAASVSFYLYMDQRISSKTFLITMGSLASHIFWIQCG